VHSIKMRGLRAAALTTALFSLLALPFAASADVSSDVSPAEHPAAHIYGSRLGLVGSTTANGHVIQDRDHFVALPSSRALSSKEGSEFTVTLSYHGKSVTAPVWDVGPWNQTDDFWSKERSGAPDLARFLPEAQAAFQSGYNQGKSLGGRLVTAPLGIDIADGTFADVGMSQSDWLDVTFNWLDN